jgi:hypothetical protein
MQMRSTFLTAAAILLSVRGLAFQKDCSEPPSVVTKFGAREVATEMLNATNPEQSVSKSGSRYIRAMLHLKTPSSCPWTLTVRDDLLHVLQTFAAADFRSPYQWTVRIPRGEVKLDLRGCDVAQLPVIAIEETIVMPDVGTSENSYFSLSTPGKPLWEPLYEPGQPVTRRPRVRSGDAVGLLMGSYSETTSETENSAAWACSGVMVASDLFLTNWHCGGPDERIWKLNKTNFWNDAVSRNLIIDISWDDDQISREFVVAEKLAAEEKLDFALLRVAPINWTGPVRPAVLARAPASLGQKLYVIHHPLGLRKQYSGSCSVQDASFKNWRDPATKTDFVHDCDTEGGSSGAPVFNGNDQVIGLHHLPYEYIPNTCTPKSRNKAVQIGEILSFLEKNLPKEFNRLVVR